MNPFKRAIAVLFATSLFVLLAFAPAFTQKKSIEDIFNVNLRNFGPVKDADAVSGYFFFYETEGGKKSERKYVLSLLDQNLEQVGKKSFTGDKYLELQEGAYNGNALALKFSNSKEEEFTIRLLDKAGERIGSKKLPFGTFDSPRYKASGASAAGLGDQTLFAIPGKGFVNYSVDTRKGAMSPTYYTIHFIPEDNGREKAWSLQSPEDNGEWEQASFLAASDDVLVSTVVKRSKLMSKDLEYFVLGTDLATGKKLFEKPIEDSKYAIMVANAWMQDGAVRYFGQYFDKDAKTAKENSLGLCTFTMSLDGEISNRRYVSWAKDVSQLLPANDKGKIEDVGYLFFHDFIPTPSGSVFGVAESYRKTTDALGVAGKVLNMGGGGGSTSKIVVEDLYVFEFSPEFELKDVTRIEKSKHDVYLPAGAAYMSPQVLSLIVLYFNGYDYVFTQKKDDLFSVGYTDFEMRKGEKNGLVYGAVNYLDGELSSDKIDLATDAEELRVLPAKTGYIAVWEYYQKEKKMDIRLERVNF